MIHWEITKYDEIINKPILEGWMIILVDSVKKIFLSIFHSSADPSEWNFGQFLLIIVDFADLNSELKYKIDF